MIRRYAVMILGFTVGVLSMHAQDLQTRNLIFRSGSTVSTLVAPNSGGPFTYNFPLSNGTLLMSTDPNLGTAGVMYSVSGSQDTATQGRWLFNVRYTATPVLAGATAAGGANILSSAYLDANATGLSVNAVAGATSTSRGIVANASGGTTNYGIDIQSGSLKIGTLGGLLFGTSGVVSAVSTIPASVTIPAGQVTGITQYALPVGGATGLASLSTGTAGYVLISGGAVANPNWQSVASVLGANVVVYGGTAPQTASIADGANYLFNVNYSGAATGNALGAVISSDAAGGAGNRDATGLTVNALASGTGVASGIVVNTGAGNDLTINEDSFIRNGAIAINPGVNNNLTSNGTGLTMGTAAQTSPGFLTLNDGAAGTFTGTIQAAATYTANRTYILPDADGALAVITGTLNNNAFVYTNTSGAMSTTASATNGQILIGSTGVAPVAGTLSGTRGITIANGAGTITVGMPTGANDAVLRYDGTNWVNSGTVFTVTSVGNVAAAGDATLGTATSTTGGSLILHDNNAVSLFTGTLQGAAAYTADRTYTLPDATGTFAVIAGTMNSNAFVYANNAGALATTASATNGQILIGSSGAAPVAAPLSVERGLTVTNAAGSITLGMPAGTTTGATMRFDGTNWVTTGTTYGIDANGNPTLGSGGQAAASSLTFNDGNAGDNFTVTLVSPSVLTSNVSIELPTTSGTLLTTGSGWATTGNGHTVIDGTNNLIGTTTTAAVRLITDNTTRLTISSAGVVTVANLSGVTTGSALAAQEGLVIASSTGVLSKRSLADIVGSKTVAGTSDGQVAIWNTTNSRYEPVAIANYSLDASGNVTNGGTLTVTGATTANGTVTLGNQSSSGANANVAPTITTAFLEVTITNTDGTANSVTLPTGTNGQVLYMRLTVTNSAGTADVTLVNSNASIIETYAQGADYQRVLHMIYVANSSKWVVLSNVAP